MALTKVINDLADLNQSGTTNALKGCAGTTVQQPASSSSIEYLIVGGGGTASGSGSGGGGAGGYITGSTTVYHGTPTVLTIGEGAIGDTTLANQQANGNDSGFNGIRAIGGGSGQSRAIGSDGGAGGGGGNTNPATAYSGGSGTSGQGLGGGDGTTAAIYVTGGGGGAGGVGATGSAGQAGNGGSGTDVTSFISVANANLAQIGDTSNTTQVFVAGGGGGGGVGSGVSPTALGGTGGSGGGGAGSGTSGVVGTNGTSNTGGGGGGGVAATSDTVGGNGGSGVGVIKYDNTIVTGYTLNSEDTYTINWPADKFGVAYWPLNLDVKDVGGNYDGTPTDITYKTGKFSSQAPFFDGSTSHIDISAGLGTSGDRTRAMWINVSNTPPPSNGDTLYYLGDSSSNAYYESLLYQETAGASTYKIKWHDRYNTVDDDILYSTTEIATDVWYHVAIVRDGTTQKMYINGSLDNSRTNTYSIVNTTAYPLIIGSWRAATCCFYEGLIEQVRFYTGALGDSDILDIYNNSKPGSLPPLKTSSDLTTTICNFPSGTTGTALYQFQGDATDTCTTPVAYDLTEVGSPSYVTGKFGEAIQFNGTSQGVTSSSAVIPTPAATISLWYNGNGTATAEFYILGVGVGSGDYGLNISYYDDGSGAHFYGGVVDNGNYQGVGTGDTIVDASEWYHIALTWDGSTSADSMKLYLNGVLETNITPTVTAASLTYSPFGIGKLNPFNPTYAPGTVDQVRIYGSVLTPQQIYDLWQKENNIQTHFTSGSTDTLVFKEGSGEITFKNDSPPGAEIGMLRYNTTLGQMEHFNSGGWKDFTNCTTSICNYPTTARCLYTFNGDIIDACGNTTPDYLTGIYYTAGKFGQGFRALGPYSSFGYSRIGWSSGLGVDYNTSDFSISLWLKQYSYASYSACSNNALCYGYIFSGWSNSYWTLATDHTVAGNTIAWKSWGPGAGQIQTAESGIVDLNTWYHIVCTRSTTDGIQLWLNNQLVASVSGSWTAGTASVYDMIGGYGDTGYTRQGLNGSISQFRLFESVLTPEQISQLYNEVYCP